MGEVDHGLVVGELCYMFGRNEEVWSTITLISIRIRVSATRVRVADLCVLDANLHHKQVIDRPPLLCIKVLGSEGTVSEMRERVQDFLDMGVPEVWIFDPKTYAVYVCTTGSMTEHRNGVLRLGQSKIELSVEEVFESLKQE